ncbi:DUF4365 domain-containing protein [Methylobacterium variabile]|uniref:DUF4365 domain-containing protein n=1 Tax=Methylobacterium variabile TaxID=298794 RepID=UPI0009FB6BDD
MNVGYIVSKVGYAFDVPSNDYGFDGQITTFRPNAEIESEYINVQLKATDGIKILDNGQISFSLDMNDINAWLENFFPVVLVVFDAQNERGYYIIIQEYFKMKPMTANETKQ